MSLISELLEHPRDLPITAKYTVANGLIYLMSGALLLLWPGAVQTLFREAPFVGNEAALMRIVGMTLAVIGWLYWFGGLAGDRRFVAACVVDRLVLVPLVLVPLAVAGVFPHLLLTLRFSTRRLGLGVGFF
jgi:hypothetical protein